MASSKVITISIVKTQDCKKIINYKEKKVTILCGKSRHTSNVIVYGNSAYYVTQDGKLAFLAKPAVEAKLVDEEILLIESKWFEPLKVRVITSEGSFSSVIEPGESETILIERPFTRVVVTHKGKIIYEDTFASNVFWKCKREGLVRLVRLYGRNNYYDKLLVLCNNKRVLTLGKGESVDKNITCFGKVKFVNVVGDDAILLDEC